MEQSTKSDAKNANKKRNVYVLIQYNNDDNYDADVVNVCSSFESAKKKMLALIEQDFVNCDSDDDTTESYSDEDSSSEKFNKDRGEKKKSAKSIVDDLHKKYPNALSNKVNAKPEPIPGFDKKNWEHVKPSIVKQIDNEWEYYNKYGYLNYKICEKVVRK